MTQRIDHRLQTLILSSFQSLPISLPPFREANGNTLQRIQVHQENLTLARRLLQVHQLQAYYAIGEQLQNLPAPEQTYIRSTLGLSRDHTTAADRLYTLYKWNATALTQAQFSLYDIQRMNLATYLSTIHYIEILFSENEEEEEPIEWSDPDTDGDDGMGIDAEEAYPHWDDD
jgi:hypothetical protein